MPINQNIKEALKIIHEKLSKNNIKWALAGTTNMQLQGMQVEPHDLDIVIQHKDLQKVSELFSDYSASAVKELRVLSGNRALEVKAVIEKLEVQFFGGDENDIYVNNLLSGKILKIKLDINEIPCFTLEAESQVYIETKRKQKADLIQEFLNKNRMHK